MMNGGGLNTHTHITDCKRIVVWLHLPHFAVDTSLSTRGFLLVISGGMTVEIKCDTENRAYLKTFRHYFFGAVFCCFSLLLVGFSSTRRLFQFSV